MSRRRTVVGLVAVAVTIVVIAGVVGWALRRTRTVEPAPVALDQVLSAEIYLPRLNRDPRTVGVLVRNNGSEPIHVVEFELLTGSFAPTGPQEKDVVIQPGVATSLTVVPGEAQCGGELEPPLAETSAHLVVDTSGQRQEVTLALPSAADQGLETRLHLECGAQVITEKLDLTLRDWSTADDGTLHATLVIQRRSGDELITMHTMAGSVVYALTPPQSGPVGALEPGQDRLELPILATPNRCDPHVMADAKFPYLFRVWLTIADSPELAATIATEPPGQDMLVQMWLDQCGF